MSDDPWHPRSTYNPYGEITHDHWHHRSTYNPYGEVTGDPWHPRSTDNPYGEVTDDPWHPRWTYNPYGEVTDDPWPPRSTYDPYGEVTDDPWHPRSTYNPYGKVTDDSWPPRSTYDPYGEINHDHWHHRSTYNPYGEVTGDPWHRRLTYNPYGEVTGDPWHPRSTDNPYGEVTDDPWHPRWTYNPYGEVTDDPWPPRSTYNPYGKVTDDSWPPRSTYDPYGEVTDDSWPPRSTYNPYGEITHDHWHHRSTYNPYGEVTDDPWHPRSTYYPYGEVTDDPWPHRPTYDPYGEVTNNPWPPRSTYNPYGEVTNNPWPPRSTYNPYGEVTDDPWPPRSTYDPYGTVSLEDESWPPRLASAYTKKYEDPWYPQTSSNPIDEVRDEFGTLFYLAFLENGHFDEVVDLSVSINTGQSSDNDYVIINQKGYYTKSRVITSEHLKPMQMSTVDIPGMFEQIGNELSVKVVHVASDHPIGLYGSSSYSCDKFMVFPVNALGREYFTVSYYRPGYKSQFSITTMDGDTEVQIFLPSSSNVPINLSWQNNIYTNGGRIVLNLNRFEAVQMQDYADLTGTRIISNRPIAVFSGNYAGQPLSNYLVEQMSPVRDWGTTFYVVPPPNLSHGESYSVYFVCSVSRTTAEYWESNESRGSFMLINTGDSKRMTIEGYFSLVIKSSKPILVAQFIGNNVGNNFAMIVIPPENRYKSLYRIATSGFARNSKHFLLLVAESNDRLTLNGKQMSSVSWANFGTGTKKSTFIEILPGVSEIQNIRGGSFGAYAFGYSDSCSYAIPAGMCFTPQV